MIDYSVFIKFVKYGFLLVSAIILLLVFYNNEPLDNQITTNNVIENNDFQSVTQVLQKPTFMGVDKKNQPFKVMASKATRFKRTPDIFNLEEPIGEMNSGEERFFLSGDEGVFNKEVQQLKVTGNVRLNDQEDMIFKTSEMQFDFKKETLSGNKSVTGEKKNSFIYSEGFEIFERGKKIIFTGKSKLILKNDK
ncbi:MAG: LPS export ABC transporter periplasmic protein LptC [Alphaproteobacteria bacterium]|tara:strand:+ start:908 stop:1486 length:579 start_codon:yes stop_codon:yes gene_type:complete